MSDLLMCFGCKEEMLLDQKTETIVCHALALKVLVSQNKKFGR